MKLKVKLLFVLLPVILILCSCERTFFSGESADAKLSVVVVTAGHGFKEKPFFAIFESFDDIEYAIAHQKDDSEIFEDITDWDYDVIVLYNMTQKITPKRRENFVKLLDKGTGVVALHHNIAAFQNWPEYEKIIGAKYYLKAAKHNGTTHQAGTYKHDVQIKVNVVNKSHPITRGMSDFIIKDETYKKCTFASDNKVLLSTDEPTSDGPLCWVRKYKNARVCYIQLGHGPSAYQDENYRKLVKRAIKYSAGVLD